MCCDGHYFDVFAALQYLNIRVKRCVLIFVSQRKDRAKPKCSLCAKLALMGESVPRGGHQTAKGHQCTDEECTKEQRKNHDCKVEVGVAPPVYIFRAFFVRVADHSALRFAASRGGRRRGASACRSITG